MRNLDQMVEANRIFLGEGRMIDNIADKVPKRGLALVTCMDARLVEMLETALGLRRGDAIVIKAAGTIAANCLGVVLRSLIIAVYELGVSEVVIVGHDDCGATQTSPARLKAKMLVRGIEQKWLDHFEQYAFSWLNNVTGGEKEVEKLVVAVRANPLIPPDVSIHGVLVNSLTGKLSIMVNGYPDVALHCEHIL